MAAERTLRPSGARYPMTLNFGAATCRRFAPRRPGRRCGTLIQRDEPATGRRRPKRRQVAALKMKSAIRKRIHQCRLRQTNLQYPRMSDGGSQRRKLERPERVARILDKAGAKPDEPQEIVKYLNTKQGRRRVVVADRTVTYEQARGLREENAKASTKMKTYWALLWTTAAAD